MTRKRTHTHTQVIYGPPDKGFIFSRLVPRDELEEFANWANRERHIAAVLPMDLPADIERRESGRVPREALRDRGRARYVVIDIDDHGTPDAPRRDPLSADAGMALARRAVELFRVPWESVAAVVLTGGGVQVHLALDEEVGGALYEGILGVFRRALDVFRKSRGRPAAITKQVDESSFQLGRHQRLVGSINRKYSRPVVVQYIFGPREAPQPLPVVQFRRFLESEGKGAELAKAWDGDKTQINKLRERAHFLDFFEPERIIDRGGYVSISCPFHGSQTGTSATIYKHEWGELLVDHHDGASYDIYSFLQAKHGVSFREAAEEVAERYGVKLKWGKTADVGWVEQTFGTPLADLRAVALADADVRVVFPARVFPLAQGVDVLVPFQVLSAARRLQLFCLSYGLFVESPDNMDEIAAAVMRDIIEGGRITRIDAEAAARQEAVDAVDSAIMAVARDLGAPTLEDESVSAEDLRNLAVLFDAQAPAEVYLNAVPLHNAIKSSVSLALADLRRLLETAGWQRKRISVTRGSVRRRWRVYAMPWAQWAERAGLDAGVTRLVLAQAWEEEMAARNADETEGAEGAKMPKPGDVILFEHTPYSMEEPDEPF